jgi:hypothetical protein
VRSCARRGCAKDAQRTRKATRPRNRALAALTIDGFGFSCAKRLATRGQLRRVHRCFHCSRFAIAIADIARFRRSRSCTATCDSCLAALRLSDRWRFVAIARHETVDCRHALNVGSKRNDLPIPNARRSPEEERLRSTMPNNVPRASVHHRHRAQQSKVSFRKGFSVW